MYKIELNTLTYKDFKIKAQPISTYNFSLTAPENLIYTKSGIHVCFNNY